MIRSYLFLTWRSFVHRRLSVLLTALCLSLSVSLFLIIDKARESSERGFSEAISQVDLIVGARSGALQLLLYTLFDMGQPVGNVSMESYKEWKNHPAVEWTIPISLGDGHRGFRTVATDQNFFEYYRFRRDQKPELEQGQIFNALWDVVIGSEVAQRLNYQMGQKIVLSHGVTRSEGVLNHDDRPFLVVGILQPTGTPIDRSLFISLEGMEALHVDWENGSPARETRAASEIQAEALKVKSITSFFLRTKSRIETLQLQRQINTNQAEALMAIIPGATLAELWRGLSFLEGSLKIISFAVVFIGFISMILVLMLSLEERRREMSIHRVLGAKSWDIYFLYQCEAFFLTVLGVVLGFIFYCMLLPIFQFFLAREFNFYIQDLWPTKESWIFALMTIFCGLFFGMIPALRARSLALKDGLSVKV